MNADTEYLVKVYNFGEQYNTGDDYALIGVHTMTKFPLWSDVLSLHPSAIMALISGKFKGYNIRSKTIHENRDIKAMYGDTI